MKDITRIKINVADPYEVLVGSSIMDDTSDVIASLGLKCDTVAIVSDTNVAPIYLERVKKSLTDGGYTPKSFVFKAGEESKNINTFTDILEFFAESGLTRRDAVIALGGGVVGDMTGFASGVYMRGVPYIQMPTTLLSDIDSSVGGKTAIDLRAGKNLAGLFVQPKAVICDLNALDTLSDEVFADGMAEVIKTAILGDKVLFELLEKSHLRENIREIVERCVRYKGGVVSRDEREKGERQLLNIGHTPAHSIEKISKYTVSHGKAVAMGLAIMTRSASARGRISSDDEARILGLIEKYTLPTDCPYGEKELSSEAFFDKKRHGDSINLIEISGLEKCEICRHSLAEVEFIFKSGLSKKETI